jgi:hypothetical protein
MKAKYKYQINTMSQEKAQSTAQEKAQSKAHCVYCDSNDHDIVECPKDNDLDKILSSDENPHFEKCSLRILKKIATIVGIRSSYPKIQLALILQSTWAYKKKKRTEEIEKVKRELATLHMTSQIEECPICMDTIGQLGSSTTKCGHKFCTPCFVKTVTRKNTCPMCRTEIMEKTEYAESMKQVPQTDSTFHIRTFVPPAAPPTAPPTAPPYPTAAAHMYAYTFTEPVDPELSYHAQDDDPDEEALYQYQVQATAHQSDTIINSDIYIDRNPATLDLSSANIDECLEWWLTMTPSTLTTTTTTTTTMPSSMLTSILIPAPNMIQSLGIYTQQYNTNANANMIP